MISGTISSSRNPSTPLSPLLSLLQLLLHPHHHHHLLLQHPEHSPRGRTVVLEGLPATRPSVTGVGDVRQVYDLSTNLPADEAGIDLAALQAAQMTNADAAQLSRLKGFSFSFVMFKEIKLLCHVSTGVPRVFLAVHNLSHAGTRVTRRMLTKRWVWMGGVPLEKVQVGFCTPRNPRSATVHFRWGGGDWGATPWTLENGKGEISYPWPHNEICYCPFPLWGADPGERSKGIHTLGPP